MPLRFLIADDSATNRKLFTMVAERMGHHADAAASGREAIDFFDAHIYDIGFFDLTMPQMDGFALARHIGQHHPRRIPLYAVSGFIDADVELRALGAGYRRCFEKPLDRDKILQAIGESGLATETPPSPAQDMADIPLRLLPVYAEELRARAAACQRYWLNRDTAALRREAHTLRALADMLKTAAVAEAASRVEHIHIPPAAPAAVSPPPTEQEKDFHALYTACLQAAASIERAAARYRP